MPIELYLIKTVMTLNEETKVQWRDLNRLILVVGHAIYVGPDSNALQSEESWVLQPFQKGDVPRYVEHIRFGVELAASREDCLLIFSGGRTRLKAGPKSEAEGYCRFAAQSAWWHKPAVGQRATTEDFARDSFENLLFGIARFRECIGRYPESVEIVGWAFKEQRFEMHRRTLRWPNAELRYKYHGINNPDSLEESLQSESELRLIFEKDPFGTEPHLREKRLRRDPFQQRIPYSVTCPEIAGLLNHETSHGRIFRGALPWDS